MSPQNVGSVECMCIRRCPPFRSVRVLFTVMSRQKCISVHLWRIFVLVKNSSSTVYRRQSDPSPLRSQEWLCLFATKLFVQDRCLDCQRSTSPVSISFLARLCFMRQSVHLNPSQLLLQNKSWTPQQNSVCVTQSEIPTAVPPKSYCCPETRPFLVDCVQDH